MDAAGRSSSKVMTDERVRKALIMAIDRERLVHNLLPDGKGAEMAEGICLKSTENCVPSTKPLAYDPAQAKRLLVEAGYADGFDLTLYAFQPFAYFAQAVAGELRKIGIRASIEPMPLAVYSKKRSNGELTTFVGIYATGGLPMMSNIMDVFFGADRDYANDPILQKALEIGATEFDSGARNKIYGPAIDRVNEKAYILPIAEVPMAWAHSKDVKLMPNAMSTLTPRLGDYAWSDYKE